MHLLGPLWYSIFLLSLILVGLWVSYRIRRGGYVPIITELVELFERPEEMRMPGQGTIHFLAGVLLATLITRDARIVDVAIIVLSVGDGVSTIVGTRFGSTPIPYNPKKSLEGSLAGFASAATLTSLWTGDPVVSVLASLVGSAAETVPRLNDNIVVPVSVALFLLWWWNR